ncbi:piggyBac transposable element-derived protein 4-like [Ptychodera flava]|uniref:piggyBac transposable element-derived protein 4-like n=1 Tax=Ptychodera flava TaxID=63121 RepID=UPI00396AAF79
MCELAIDEGVIPYRGRTKNVLYNPAKPHKYGMRVYTLSESATGYLFNDEVHQPDADNCHHPLDPNAADNPRVFRGNRPGQVVSRLIRPYYELGHHVIMDSYYTSAPLFDHLYVHNIAATGTCRMYTLGLPNEIKNAANYDPQVVPPDADDEERWPRGSFSVFQDGAMTVCAWKDTKMVKFMSTAVSARRPNQALLRRPCKDKRTGAFEQIEVICPNIAVMYNQYFRGVDLTDQHLGYYTPGRSSPRWHRAVFYQELNKALMNAFHNMASVHGYGQSGSRYRRQLTFRAQVTKQLIGNFSSLQRPPRRN